MDVVTANESTWTSHEDVTPLSGTPNPEACLQSKQGWGETTVLQSCGDQEKEPLGKLLAAFHSWARQGCYARPDPTKHGISAAFDEFAQTTDHPRRHQTRANSTGSNHTAYLPT